MRILPGSLAASAMLLALGPTGIHAQARGQPNLLTFGIVGSTGDAPARLNPTMQLDQLAVQRLVLAAAQSPRDRRYVDSALTGTGLAAEDLVTTDLLRLRDGRYVIGFSLFTRDDVVRMRAVAEAEAKTLAEAYLARRVEIESILRRYDAAGVDRRMVAYIVIGCFSLDWDGLDLTAERGYRAATRPHPGGGSYGVWAEERGGLSLRGIYWGSHNATYRNGTVKLTSFGDHFSVPRSGLPDLLWRLSGSMSSVAADSGLRPALVAAGREGLDEVGGMLGGILLALREGELDSAGIVSRTALTPPRAGRLLRLLVDLEYVRLERGRYQLAAPVLAARDSGLVRDLMRLSREVMSEWLGRRYSPIEGQLSGLTAVRAGVPYTYLFSQIWHYLFGTTNRLLVEAGLFADPYARRYPGFIPVARDASLVPGW